MNKTKYMYAHKLRQLIISYDNYVSWTMSKTK